MIQHTICLGYHCKKLKKSCKILLKKDRKRDFGLVCSYPAIGLLNYLGKVVEKIMAKQLILYCEIYFKLYLG